MPGASRRGFLAGSLTAGRFASELAVCKVLDAGGAPLAVEELRRFHLCDLLLRPFAVTPEIAPGEARFQPPDKPFRIGLTMVVPGFGHLVVYADNRGRGYTPQSFAQPLTLNQELAADRIATVRRLVDQMRRSGHDVPPGPARRLEKAEALADRGAWSEALAEALWAGEEVTLDRARQEIGRRGARPGFLFGANAFAFPRLGRPYAGKFEAVFNYGTLPFYLGPTERVQGQPNWGSVEKILGWLRETRILAKGHPLVWFYPPTTPDWLRNKPFDEVKRLCLDYVRRAVTRFRDRIHAWDVINEAHVQNVLGFNREQQIEMTAGAARAGREADPTCFRVVNCCCTWSEYMSRRPNPGQQSVYDYLAAVRDARIDFEAIGLQYYYSGRDLVEIERSIETFKDFGKPIHITELGLPSSSREIKNPWGQTARYPWHGEEWSETAQADWVEQFYTIAFSKPWIEAVTWWDMCDPAFIPHGGLLNQDLTPKQSYLRLKALIEKWQAMA